MRLFHHQAAGTGVIGSSRALMRWVQWYLITSCLGGSNTNKRAWPEAEGREELHVSTPAPAALVRPGDATLDLSGPNVVL